MCHSRHHPRGPVERPVEDKRPQDPTLRASDREREDTVTQLREHEAAGRLDVDELEERVGAAYAARTRGDLSTLLRDLPARPRREATAYRGRAHHQGGGWLALGLVTTLLVVIWAANGAGYPWPAWVVGWWAFALVMRTRPGRLRTR